LKGKRILNILKIEIAQEITRKHQEEENVRNINKEEVY